MPRIPGLRRIFRLATREAPIARDVDDELAFHFAMAEQELMRRGLSADAARAEARRRFGDVEARRAELRSIDRRRHRARRAGEWLQGVAQDVRVAARALRRAPGFAAVIVLTLALGIGANAMMFGVVDRLLLRPPAYLRDAERTARLYFTRVADGRSDEFDHVGYPLLRDLQEGAGTAADLVGVTSFESVIGDGADARLGQLGQASGAFWSLFDARPALGRFFGPAEDRLPAGARVAVLGYDYWRGRLGGDPSVVGRALRLGGATYTVVGVAPKGFTGVDLRRVDAWVPLTAAAAADVAPDFATRYTMTWFVVIARRHAGVSPAAANAQLTRAYLAHLGKRPNGARFGGDRPSTSLYPILRERGPHRSDGARVSVWVLGVAAIVLLVACANVANLLLARGLQREREVAVRVALGVGRPRLARQLLAETTLLAALGAAAGLALAQLGGALVTRVLMPQVDWGNGATDPRRLAVTGAIALGAALLASAMPALRALRPDVVTRLRGDARAGGARHARVRGALVLAQATLSALLLVGAGLFVRSLRNVRAVEFGFTPDRVALATLDLRGERVPSAERAALYRRMMTRLRALPFVESVGTTFEVPYYMGNTTGVRLPGRDSVPGGGEVHANMVGDDYFAAMGTTVLRGRVWTRADAADPEGVVVSARLARLAFGDADPIGRCLIVEDPADAPCRPVLGVVQDVRRGDPREEATAGFYRAWRGETGGDVTALVVRTRGDARRQLLAIQRALQPMAPGAAYVGTRTMADLVSPELRPWRLGATLFALFGALAFVVAAVGLYSAVAYDVAQQRRDIGVRLALGARAGDVLRLVVRRGVAVAVAGVVLGLSLALVAAPRVAPLLFGVSPHDPLTLGAAAAALLGAAVLASAVPGRRAARLDPGTALRAE